MLLLNYRGAELVIMLCIRLLIVFTILPVHEFSHAYAARKLGDNTALIAGRLTLNPLAHIDPVGTVLLLLFGFGWAKPVPVNPRNFSNFRRDNAIVSAAGPLSNLVCAVVAIFANRFILNVYAISEGSVATVMFYVYNAVYYFSIINLSLCIFNLLPIRPLDGSNILSYFLPAKANAFLYKHTRVIQIVLYAAVFLGLLSGPLSWLISKVYTLLNFLFGWVDLLFGLILR